MNRDFVYIEELGEHVGERVTLKGWLAQKRSSGKIKFLVVRDGTGYLQCVAFVKDVSAELFERCDTIPLESSIVAYWTKNSTNSPRISGVSSSLW